MKRIRAEVTLQYLERRAQRQRSETRDLQAFHDFHFTNRVEETGIRFEHRFVDDAGRHYKAAQYDHGNGVAAADVDGDGRSDLYFTSQLGQNQLWRNQGAGHFENITDRAGVGLENQVSVAAAFADVDNDGAPDLFVTTVRHGNHLFRNQGGGKFQDVTGEAGVGYVGHSSAPVFFDFDQDGWLDLFVANVGIYTSDLKGPDGSYAAFTNAFDGHLFPDRTEYSLLYRNLGHGKFREVSQEMRVRDGSWSGEATAADLNQDGFPDLYLANMQGDDHYYENDHGRGFVERTAAYFPKTPWGSLGVKSFDFDQDGRPDLFVTDMHSDMTRQQTEQAISFRPDIEKAKSEPYCTIQWTDAYLQGASNNLFGNAFFLNRGRGEFAEASDRLGAETYWPWGPSVGDLNADGFEDAFITAGMGYPFRYAINSVLLNDGGRRFYDTEFLLGVEPRRGGLLGREWFTLDCSGEDKAEPLCAGKSGTVAVPGSLSSRSAVLLDLDNDGDLDIVTNEFGDQPQVLFSNLTDRSAIHFLKVRLVGTSSNRDGIGASVKVSFGGRNYFRYHDGKSGYLGQSSLPLYFGLGDATKVDEVQIRWPSGRKQTLTSNLPVNGLLEVREDQP